jgi:hypothetical protein
MQEVIRGQEVHLPDIYSTTTSADTYRNPGLQFSRSKTMLGNTAPANYEVFQIPLNF